MPLYVYNGALLVRDGALAAAASCCCGCPDGCPPLDGCNLVVVLNYPGNPVEVVNFPASDYVIDEYTNCQLAFSVEDINIESGGDINAIVTVAYDENCNLVVSSIVITRTVDSPENEQSCDDGVTECVEVLVSIDCNPLP